MLELIDLPTYIQVMLVSGFIGYSVARQGYKPSSQQTFFYGVLLFGIPSLLLFNYIEAKHPKCPMYAVVAACIVLSWFIGALWRVRLANWYNDAMNYLAVSNDDGYTTAWNTIMQRTDIIITQISVYLKNGGAYHCIDVQKYGDEAIPLFLADQDGNIAIYVEEYKKAGSEDGFKKSQCIIDEHYGARLTHFNHDEIERVSIRSRNKTQDEIRRGLPKLSKR